MTKQQHLAIKEDLEQIRIDALKVCNAFASLACHINDPKIERRNLFKVLLRGHDWFYIYSDDYGSRLRGEKEEEELYKMMKEDPELTELYNEARPKTGV